jgi:uncharacterized protein YjbJ (UPF0337 family)
MEPDALACVVDPTQKESKMAGEWDKTKGAVKDAVGGLTGDTKTQAQGKLDKAKGEMKHQTQNVKDALNDAKEDMQK